MTEQQSCAFNHGCWWAACVQVGAMQLLVERGAEVHACDKLGRTPLHKAAANRKLEAINALVSTFSAAVNACDKLSDSCITPLHSAAEHGQVSGRGGLRRGSKLKVWSPLGEV